MKQEGETQRVTESFFLSGSDLHFSCDGVLYFFEVRP